MGSLREKGRECDDRHAIRLEDVDPETGRLYIEIRHPQDCQVWKGCQYRGEPGDQFVPNPGAIGDCCPPHHHAHMHFGCGLGYLEDTIGPADALGLDLFNVETDGNHPEMVEMIWRLVETIESGEWLEIDYEFSYGFSSYDGEYDEHFGWRFRAAE